MIMVRVRVRVRVSVRVRNKKVFFGHLKKIILVETKKYA